VADVKLEVLGWIAAACGHSQGGSLSMEESVENGATVGDLLRHVAKRDRRFKNIVFTGDLSLQGNISIVLNGKILGQPAFLEARLKDGDEVMLLPAIDGG
jgi:molybdopterin converting factor small subunit